jgi:estrone sulfotransferase
MTSVLLKLRKKLEIMVVFKDLPKSQSTEILDRAFHIKDNFFDAGNECILPKKYKEISEQVKNLKIRDDDVFLCSFPRTGSTWLQEVLWLLGNKLDFNKAQETIQQVKILFFYKTFY